MAELEQSKRLQPVSTFVCILTSQRNDSTGKLEKRICGSREGQLALTPPFVVLAVNPQALGTTLAPEKERQSAMGQTRAEPAIERTKWTRIDASGTSKPL
jgi:hypothetical protein